MEEHSFHYNLNEAPPFFKNLAYGLQWIIVTLPSIIVFSALGSAALHLDPAGHVSFSQRLLLMAGLMTVLQSLNRSSP
jgi:xanthine/uracil permease